MSRPVALKILTPDEWRTFQTVGEFAGAPIDFQDGYIHLSTWDQAAETLDKYFANLPSVVVAEVDLSLLDDVRWEASRGGALFPHQYGVLPLRAVTRWAEGAPGEVLARLVLATASGGV
ncbi:DUF952 domain-containing protein [Brevundimonas sp. 2R-24]|uniref:DUF952 domain-containing protein n=1 Tax=Peiella sedimenti TaxID=3061083 RepID=A0ABT8SN45_9CAUL|nr:DUF952 domain-containing protein [Caulobacteraceae bacterium XZ-24]